MALAVLIPGLLPTRGLLGAITAVIALPLVAASLAVAALMGSFIFHNLAVGRPPKGWSEAVLDTLWPAFAA